MTVANLPTTTCSETDTRINQITQVQDNSTRGSGINQAFIIPPIPSGDSRINQKSKIAQIPDATPSANLKS